MPRFFHRHRDRSPQRILERHAIPAARNAYRLTLAATVFFFFVFPRWLESHFRRVSIELRRSRWSSHLPELSDIPVRLRRTRAGCVTWDYRDKLNRTFLFTQPFARVMILFNFWVMAMFIRSGKMLIENCRDRMSSVLFWSLFIRVYVHLIVKVSLGNRDRELNS